MSEKLTISPDSDKVLDFFGWLISYPKSSDYQYLANEEILIIEFKGKRIAEFTFFADRLNIKANHCKLSVGDKNINLFCELDESYESRIRELTHYCMT